MTYQQSAFKSAAESIINNLRKRGMEGIFCENTEILLNQIKEMMQKNCVVSFGGSESLKESGVMDLITSGDYQVVNYYSSNDPEERRKLLAETMMSDYFFCSTNAITLEGELINIDGNANRVACLCQGPREVYLIVGMNKVVADIDAGVKRVQNTAAPANAKRLNRMTPCNQNGKCGKCLAKDCMCSQILITRRSSQNGRIKVFLVAENLGY